MRVTTTIDIDASASAVWDILVDFSQYPAWNPLTVRVEGVPGVDEVVKLHVDLGGRIMVRKHVVSRVDAPTALCWTIRTRRPWLMRGERCQRIEPRGDGRCRYINDERVDGLASYLVALTFKRVIRRALERTGEALKDRAESP